MNSLTRVTGTFELEEHLKADNPKGRLLEACTRLRLAAPQIRHAPSGPRHRAQMLLEVDEWELDSGVHWASSRKAAEQLAARALLTELEGLVDEGELRARPALRASAEPSRAEAPGVEQIDGDDVFDVDEEDVARLRQSNPKGQVYEWCQKQRPPARRPRFEERKLGRGVVAVRGRLEALELVSPWFRSLSRKEAERAAAEALLRLLAVDADAEADETANPRTVLNELVFHGQLADCQVEVTGRRGAAHAPIFEARARASLPDGRVLSTEAYEGASKREAKARASRALLALLE